MIASRNGVAVLIKVLVLAVCAVSLPAVVAVDRADAARRACTIIGTPRADHLRGTNRDDVICGRGGNDVIRGRHGDDVLYGGGGDDVLIGGTGRDRLVGGRGSDDLLEGNPVPGPGADWCGGLRPTRRCDGGDGRPPTVVRAQVVSAATLDVSWRSQIVDVRARVRDDIGVKQVELELVGPELDGRSVVYPAGYPPMVQMRRTRGTARDGWWTGSVVVPLGALAGSYQVRIRPASRYWESSTILTGATTAVVTNAPDLQPPTLVELVQPLAGEVRSRRAPGGAEVELTDDRSGVSLVWFCYGSVRDGEVVGSRPCTSGELVRGTTTHGWWRAPQLQAFDRLLLGYAEIDVTIYDAAGRSVTYWGPVIGSRYPDPRPPWAPPIPDGRGGFTVVE